jgi:tryptophanyl-tRNA synthetase
LSSVQLQQRVLSGMRPTGKLHLGHYHGVLKNWVELQHEYDCFFFVADWHALTTHYENPFMIEESVYDMVIDWLAAGVNPGSSTMFIQSMVPEHAELHLLLSMMTPLGWLERVPTYKDQQEKLKEKDLATYGFLGYPLLQSADILAYRAGLVPVGADQVAHVELTREVARRFNHLYGKDPGYEEQAEAAIKKMGKKNAKLYRNLQKRFQEQGDDDALATARALIIDQQNISLGDRERLLGFIEGGGKVILPEPQPLLTASSKMPGLDGQKMSKSYGNTIGLREAPDDVNQKIRKMQTDPQRVRLTDPGNPDKCPVWNLHEVYSDKDVKKWVRQGCQRASIGCLDCKKPLIEKVLEEQKPIHERARQYEENPELVKSIISEGSERARDAAKATLEEVRKVMGLSFGR